MIVLYHLHCRADVTGADAGGVLLTMQRKGILTMSSVNDGQEYWVPECIRTYLQSLGYVLPLEDMKEVGVTMARWEYLHTWYGEDESTARRMAAEVGTDVPGSVG